MTTVLALSPHLDDAVFSAGGTLAALTAAGHRVVVATVFTRSVPQPKGFALACQLDKGLGPEIDYMALRRSEDAAACAVLRAEPRWLPLPEAPHRGYGSPPALFAGLHDEDTVVDDLLPVLQTLLAELAPDLILAPQAIGGHVDHCALVLALDALSPTATTLWWRDYPYVVRDADRPEPFGERFGALPQVARRYDDACAAAKLAAALRYESQLGFQFGGAERLRAAWQHADRVEHFRSSRPPADPLVRALGW